MSEAHEVCMREAHEVCMRVLHEGHMRGTWAVHEGCMRAA